MQEFMYIYDKGVHQKEQKLLKMIYQDLGQRISEQALNKENFLLFFHKNGYWGDCLFQQFDADSSNLISEEQFIKGIVAIFNTSKDDKIKFLFKFFSKNKSELVQGITFKNFLTILYNYPKQDFKKVLNDSEFVNKELRKHLISIDSQDNGRRLLSLYNNDPKNKNLNGMKFKIDESDSGGSQKLQSKVGTAIIKHMNKSAEGKCTTLQIKVGDNNVEIQTASIHHLVKKLAKTIFKEYNLDVMTGKLKYDQFHDWMSKHQNLYNDYYKGFHNEVWGFNSETQQPLFVFTETEMKSKAKFIEGKQQRPKKIILTLLNSIMIACEEEDPENPIMIICLEGLSVKKMFEPTNGHGIEISHRDGIYPMKKFFFLNENLSDGWMEHLKYFKGASIAQLYKMSDKIGIGKFSVVYRCVEKGKGQNYAIKVIQTFKLDNEAKRLIAHESSIMSILEHPLLVRHKETVTTKTHIYIVTELVNGKDMFEFVKELKYLCEYEAAYIIQQIIVAVRYMHSLGIIHRDLKPQNIMIQYNENTKEIGRIKIIDFGFANYLSKVKELQSEQKQEFLAGTPNYIAPQMLRNQKPVTEKIDNFAIGSILYFALSGNFAFHGFTLEQTYRRTLNGIYSLNDKRWKQISSSAKELIQRLLQIQPEERISLDEALRHQWFSQCNIKTGNVSVKEVHMEKKHSALVF